MRRLLGLVVIALTGCATPSPPRAVLDGETIVFEPAITRYDTCSQSGDAGVQSSLLFITRSSIGVIPGGGVFVEQWMPERNTRGRRLHVTGSRFFSPTCERRIEVILEEGGSATVVCRDRCEAGPCTIVQEGAWWPLPGRRPVRP